jgi:hypothetical protein
MGKEDNTPPEAVSAADKAVTLDISLGSILTLSDLGTAVTSYGFQMVYGSKPSGKRAAEAVLISVISRILSRNFPNMLGSDSTEEITKNYIVVGVINAMVAAGMNRSISREVVTGVASDLLSDQVFKSLDITDTVLIGGGSKK